MRPLICCGAASEAVCSTCRDRSPDQRSKPYCRQVGLPTADAGVATRALPELKRDHPSCRTSAGSFEVTKRTASFLSGRWLTEIPGVFPGGRETRPASTRGNQIKAAAAEATRSTVISQSHSTTGRLCRHLPGLYVGCSPRLPQDANVPAVSNRWKFTKPSTNFCQIDLARLLALRGNPPA
jgi:hypothetical protein